MNHLYNAIERGEFHIALPRPEDIPDEKIAAALSKFIDAQERVNRVRVGRNSAKSDLTSAAHADTVRGTEANDRGEDDPDPLLLQAPAKVEYERALARVDPAINARRIAYGELVGTINANAEVWKEASRTKADAALKRVAAALRTVELARVEFENHLGVVEMLSRTDRKSLASDWRIGNVETGLAVDALGTAIGKISRGVHEL